MTEKSLREWTNSFNPFNSFKVLAWYDRMQKIKTGNFAPPVNVALDINSGSQAHKKCLGLNCNFCMSNFEEEPCEAEIPYDVLMKIPSFYKEWGVLSICVPGHHSDPLSYNHTHLKNFLQSCHFNGIDVGFVSNGYGYTDLTINAIAHYCKFAGFSINAGNRDVHSHITRTDSKVFDRIINNITKMSDVINKNNLDCQIGYKFLITDDSYSTIYEGAKLARDIGVRHFQIRPCELPDERRKKIDIDEVNRQIEKSMELEVPGKFEIFGVRHKFTSDFKKKSIKRCIASPLGSTWMANGDVVICPDRRWSRHLPDMVLGNFVKEGLEAIRRKWGGPEHLKMIEAANLDLKNCIRCTSIAWHEMVENTVFEDNMDISLI